jgi:hypothetical protein
MLTLLEDRDRHVPVRVDDSMTVRAVKMNFAIECGRTDLLPGAVSLQFGPLELRDTTKIMAYGIPHRGLVTVILGDTQTLCVIDANGNATNYSCSYVDTIGTLFEFLAAKKINCEHLAVMCNGTEQELSQLLLNLPILELHLVKRVAPLQVEVNGLTQTINVTCDCSLAELVGLLAQQLEVDVDRIRLEPPPNSDQLVFSVADIIKCNVLEPSPAVPRSDGPQIDSPEPRSVVHAAATSRTPDAHSAESPGPRPGLQTSATAEVDSSEAKQAGHAAAPEKAKVTRQPVVHAAKPPKDSKTWPSHRTGGAPAPDARRPKAGKLKASSPPETAVYTSQPPDGAAG